jgi:O-antigen/teichoic acid export membrane protein
MDDKTVKNDTQTKEIKSLGVKENLFFNILIQVLTYLIPLFTAPYLSRVLTPTGIGTISYAKSIVSYFSLVVSFGFMDYGIQHIASKKHSKEDCLKQFWSIVWARTFIFLVVIVVYFSLAYFWGFGDSGQQELYYILSLSIFSQVIDFTFLFKGLENYKIISLLNLGSKILGIVLIYTLIKSKNDLYIYAIIIGAEALFITISLFIYSFKFIFPVYFCLDDILETFKQAFFYFLPTIATTIFSVVDITILGAMSTKEQVGYYEQANKIKDLINGVTCSICPIFIARMSALREQKNEIEIKHKFTQLANAYSLLAFPCFFGTIAVAPYFIPAFFGEAYLQSVNVMYWLAPLILFTPLSYSLCSAYYVPNGKINYITIFEFITAGLNLIGNILILKYTSLGAVGVAITSFGAELLMMIFTLLFSYKHINIKEMALKIVKPFIASVVMFAVVIILNHFISQFVGNNIWITIIDVGTGIFCYAVAILLLKDEMVISGLSSIKNKFFKKKVTEDKQ